jgi:hypothetical protein
MKITGLFVILALTVVVLTTKTQVGLEVLKNNSLLWDPSKGTPR